MRNLQLACIFYCCLFLVPSPALAWGERGHDLVTRVAVKTLSKISTHGEAISKPFELRDHMLSHLSNAPDFHWRARYMSKLDRDLNYPTHFIGVETVYPERQSISEIDFDIAALYTAAEKAKISDAASIGSAPWRVLQLHRDMTDALVAAKAAKNRRQMIDATNQALLYAGIMSHFVGDLANPHHTAVNYNGQLTGNTGLHAYFEDDVVRALPLSLDADVDSLAGIELLHQTVLTAYPQADRKTILANAEKLIFALTLESNSKVDQLHSLDDEVSILTRSLDAETDAIRKRPEEVMDEYRPFISERIAVGASVLAQLWLLAWEQAGQPDLSDFHSYHYFVKPDFIEPDYLRK